MRLKACPPVRLPDHTTKGFSLYHTPDLGVGELFRVEGHELRTAMQRGQVDPLTVVYLRYCHGNLFALMKPQELPASLTHTQDVYLWVDTQVQVLAGWELGKHTKHHALYDYGHLDGKTTTVEKLVKSERFTSVTLAVHEDFEFCDIPY